MYGSGQPYFSGLWGTGSQEGCNKSSACTLYKNSTTIKCFQEALLHYTYVVHTGVCICVRVLVPYAHNTVKADGLSVQELCACTSAHTHTHKTCTHTHTRTHTHTHTRTRAHTHTHKTCTHTHAPAVMTDMLSSLSMSRAELDKLLLPPFILPADPCVHVSVCVCVCTCRFASSLFSYAESGQELLLKRW